MGQIRPMKATDKRRSGVSDNVSTAIKDTDGAGPQIVDMQSLFNDRRLFSGTNGRGKKVY